MRALLPSTSTLHWMIYMSIMLKSKQTKMLAMTAITFLQGSPQFVLWYHWLQDIRYQWYWSIHCPYVFDHLARDLPCCVESLSATYRTFQNIDWLTGVYCFISVGSDLSVAHIMGVRQAVCGSSSWNPKHRVTCDIKFTISPLRYLQYTWTISKGLSKMYALVVRLDWLIR